MVERAGSDGTLGPGCAAVLTAFLHDALAALR
jgi:hypothetical protein